MDVFMMRLVEEIRKAQRGEASTEEGGAKVNLQNSINKESNNNKPIDDETNSVNNDESSNGISFQEEKCDNLGYSNVVSDKGVQ